MTRYVPIFIDEEEMIMLECAYDGVLYPENEMATDSNGDKTTYVHVDNLAAYIEKMTKQLELNEPYKLD